MLQYAPVRGRLIPALKRFHGIEPVAYSYILATLAWPLAVLGPPIVAMTAAVRTNRNAADPEFPVTQLAEKEVVQCYALAVLYRLRVLLAVIVGISPLLVMGMLSLALTGLVSQIFVEPCISPFALSPSFNCYSPTTLDVIGPLVEIGMVVMGMLALNVLASVIGVTLALWWRRSPKVAAYLAMVVTLQGALFGIIIMLTVLSPTIGGKGFSQLTHPLLDIALPFGGCLVLPIVLMAGMMALAVWVLRKGKEANHQP